MSDRLVIRSTYERLVDDYVIERTHNATFDDVVYMDDDELATQLVRAVGEYLAEVAVRFEFLPTETEMLREFARRLNAAGITVTIYPREGVWIDGTARLTDDGICEACGHMFGVLGWAEDRDDDD